ncbi:hypothetical protein [Nocardia sp. CA-119907]|uniref:hypothetical protein n=1 Tax=Nocardia sp. CA-119907 TaxID=3239973 RepID=UPI003D984B0D
MLAPLLRVTDPTQIHYGSDYPFTPVTEILSTAEELDNAAELSGGAWSRPRTATAKRCSGRTGPMCETAMAVYFSGAQCTVPCLLEADSLPYTSLGLLQMRWRSVGEV